MVKIFYMSECSRSNYMLSCSLVDRLCPIETLVIFAYSSHLTDVTFVQYPRPLHNLGHKAKATRSCKPTLIISIHILSPFQYENYNILEHSSSFRHECMGKYLYRRIYLVAFGLRKCVPLSFASESPSIYVILIIAFFYCCCPDERNEIPIS